jgi:uncharacterized protein YgfB (UPF0149 family)
MMVAKRLGSAVVIFALSGVGCGGDSDDTYCCAVRKVSNDTVTYKAEYLQQLKNVAEHGSEDVCRTVVESNFERFEDALYSCAGE